MRATSESANEVDLGSDLFIHLLKESLATGNPYANVPAVFSDPPALGRAILGRADMNRGTYQEHTGTVRRDRGSRFKTCGRSLKPKYPLVTENWITSARESREETRPRPPVNTPSTLPRTTKWKRVPYTQQGWVVHKVEPQRAVQDQDAHVSDEHSGEGRSVLVQPAEGLSVALGGGAADDASALLDGQDSAETSLVNAPEAPTSTEAVAKPKRKTRRAGKELRRRRENAARRAAEAALSSLTTGEEQETNERADADADEDGGNDACSAGEENSFVNGLHQKIEDTGTQSEPSAHLSEIAHEDLNNEESKRGPVSESSEAPHPQRKKRVYRRAGRAAKLRIAKEKEDREAAELAEAEAYLAAFAAVPGNVNFMQSGPWLIPKTTAEVFAPIYPSYMARDFPALPLSAVNPPTEHQDQRRLAPESPGSSAGCRATGKTTIIARKWTLVTNQFRELHQPEDEEDELEYCKTTSAYYIRTKMPSNSLFARINMRFTASGYHPLYLYSTAPHPLFDMLPKFGPGPDEVPSAPPSDHLPDSSAIPISVAPPEAPTAVHERSDPVEATSDILQGSSETTKDQESTGREASGRVVSGTENHIATPTAEQAIATTSTALDPPSSTPQTRRRVGVSCGHCGHFVPFNPVFARATRDLE